MSWLRGGGGGGSGLPEIGKFQAEPDWLVFGQPTISMTYNNKGLLMGKFSHSIVPRYYVSVFQGSSSRRANNRKYQVKIKINKINMLFFQFYTLP